METKNNKLSTHTHFTTETEWPSSLKSAKEVSDIIGISEERVLDLASGHFMPHWRIDGGVPLFNMKEAKTWAANNILHRINGETLPLQLRVMIEPPPAVDPPPTIREIANLKQLPAHEYPPGVYFLVEKEEVVYVGQSISPSARVSQHMKDKKFTHAYMIPVPSSLLNDVEGALIRAMNPKYNSGIESKARGPRGKGDDKFALEAFASGLQV